MRLEFVTVNLSVFGNATVGPGQSHMAYCRILLPHLLDVPRLIYLDSDVLAFRDLSQLFDVELAAGKLVAAVRDSETLSLADDSIALTKAMKLPAEGAYFNSGVMLMNLDELRNQHFFERAVEFLRACRTTGSTTNLLSIFFSMRTSRNYPNTGIVRPGVSTRSRTTICVACFTTRLRRHG